jgi:hypothetical protein
MEEPQTLATISLTKKLIPVAFPPGRAMFATRPNLTGSSPAPKDDRDRRGSSFGRKRSRVVAGRGDDGNATADEVDHEGWQAIVLARQPMVFNHHILALRVASFI